MSLLPLFVGRDLELRSGWRVAIYAASFVVLFVVAGTFFGSLVAWLYPDWLVASRMDIRLLGLNAAALAVPSVFALWAVAAFLDRVPVSAFGVALHDGWFRDFAAGVAVAVVMLGVTMVGSLLFGSTRVEWSFSLASLPSLLVTLVVLAVSAANEEIMFRGYPLQVLMKGVGPWGAILLLSFVFGLVHENNAGATTLSVLNTMLAGAVLSFAYLKTRSLWLPYGIHLAWNTGLAVVLGFPVSGIETPSLWTTHVSGPATILGGSYGPEDGALGTAIFVSGAIVLLLLRRLGVSRKIQEALAANAGKVWVGKA